MEGMGRCILDAINNKAGKWVCYDNEGKMLKGWVKIDGKDYYFDETTGVLQK